MPSSPGDHSSVTPFPREKTPQDLAQEAHDGEFDHLTHESSLSPSTDKDRGTPVGSRLEGTALTSRAA